jgi:predicted DsbA family dithiol-disulfide isomerase
VTAPSHTAPTFDDPSDRVVVDVWSDVICPFCHLGDTLLAQAIERSGRPVEVRYHSFQLMPELPQGPGRDVVEVLVETKGVSPEQAEAMNSQVAARAAAVGLDLRFDRALVANTRDAHRLLHLAREHGVQAEVAALLFRAYFTDGRDIGTHGVLADLAVEAGLDRDEVLLALAGDAHAEAVDADIAWARQLGISGVPFFVLDGKYAVSGAQPPELFDRALATAWDDKPR